MFIYADDVFAAEPASTVGSAWETFEDVCSLLGFEPSASKAQAPTTKIHLLGTSLTLHADATVVCLPDKKRNELINDLSHVLAHDQLNPSQAAKLRGRLGFAKSLFSGKVGRALLQPRSARQYSRAPGRFHPLSAELSEALNWWRAALSIAVPRSIPFATPRPCLVYSDACGAGRVAAVLIRGSTRKVRRAHLPKWFMEDLASIFEPELAGVVLGLRLAVSSAPSEDVLLCCDNNGARAAVVRGSCGTPLGRSMSSALWLVAAMFGVHLWVGYVASPFNTSDSDSRMCSATSNPAPDDGANLGIPALFRSIFESRVSLLAAAFKLHQVPTALVKGWDCASSSINPNYAISVTNFQFRTNTLSKQ